MAPVCQRLQGWRQSSSSTGDSDGDGIYHPPGDLEPPIPDYKPRSGENIAVLKARLLYQSRKRGMLENGLLLRYLNNRHRRIKRLSKLPVQLSVNEVCLSREIVRIISACIL